MLWAMFNCMSWQTHGKITTGNINLIPSGALQMTASWVDNPTSTITEISYEVICNDGTPSSNSGGVWGTYHARENNLVDC